MRIQAALLEGFPQAGQCLCAAPRSQGHGAGGLGNYDLDQVDPEIFSGKSAERYQAWKNGAWVWKQEEVDSFWAGSIIRPTTWILRASTRSCRPTMERGPISKTCFPVFAAHPKGAGRAVHPPRISGPTRRGRSAFALCAAADQRYGNEWFCAGLPPGF